MRQLTIVVESVLTIAVLLIPLSAHAGMFSGVTKLFAKPTAAAEVSEKADTTAAFTPLLTAVVNPDPQPVGGGDLTVVDGSLRAGGPVGANTAGTESRISNEISVYTVREGDALSYIAEMYGVTINTIVWANDLAGASDIQPGDTLVILPIAGVQHTVKKGETLTDIVDKYESDYDEVLTFNQLLDGEELTIGMELIIPGAQLHSRTVASAPAAAASGGGSWLSHPVPGAVRTQGVHGYNGVDYGAAPGTAIKAAASGEVIIAKASGWNGGYGSYVVIKHNNGAQTLYAHLNSVSVGLGDWVTVGTTIGGMGSTGRSTGTHLHFEVRGGSNPF